MVYRLSWVAGAGGILLALLRLESLLRPTAEGVPWQIVLLAAAILGAAITWAGTAYRLDGRLVVIVNLVAMAITVIRIAVPATTWLIFPTLSSFSELRLELEFSHEVIRSGVAPVIPLAGVISILALLFWVLGAMLSWGLMTGRPYLAVLTPLVAYLQFATMDRGEGSWWLWSFLIFLGAALLAVALDRRRDGTGQLISPVTRLAVPRSIASSALTALAASLMVAVIATHTIAGLIPDGTGVLEWRVRTGLTGEYYGGVAYNPFVGIHQGLVSETNAPVFVAAVEGDVAPTHVYWRLLTLETFNGIQWLTDHPELNAPEDIDSYDDPTQAFRGPTSRVTQDVTILALEMGWLPAAYSPVEMTADNRAIERGFRVKDDASLRFDAISYRGMGYTVISDIPKPDLGVLSTGDDGRLSVVFASAAEDDAFTTDHPEIPEPVSLEEPATYLDLPSGIAPGVASLAKEQTAQLTTDFERALALEAFFRAPGHFQYSTAIEPGHGAKDLSAWLVDPDSPNYRTGYCEQFATAMAVMARQLGIPSRVVLGFTPGNLLEDGRVVVRDRNAHAWVELWMPTQGWVRFDPTPRTDGINPATIGDLPFEIDRYLDIPEPVALPAPAAEAAPLIPSAGLRPEDVFVVSGGSTDGSGGSGLAVPGWVIWATLGAATLFGLVPGLKWLRRSHRMRRLASGDITAAWEDISDRLDDLRVRPPATETPLELATAVDDAMVPLAGVYGRFMYGDPSRPDAAGVVTAASSLMNTRRSLAERLPLIKKLAAQYRLRSISPRWVLRLLRKG